MPVIDVLCNPETTDEFINRVYTYLDKTRDAIDAIDSLLSRLASEMSVIEIQRIEHNIETIINHREIIMSLLMIAKELNDLECQDCQNCPACCEDFIEDLVPKQYRHLFKGLSFDETLSLAKELIDREMRYKR